MKTLTFFVCGLLMAALLNAQIIHVPANQPTIQAGIYAATTGDTVLVAEGTYLENINFMGKAITVASHFIMDADTNHINNTIIDGSQPVNPDYGSVVTFITGEDTTSVLCGFTITGGLGTFDPGLEAFFGGGIACYNASAKICFNKIINNSLNHQSRGTFGAGIGTLQVANEHWLIAEGNIISDNCATTGGFSAFGGGVYVSINAVIKYNMIINNSCQNTAGQGSYADGGGIEIEQLTEEPIIVEVIDNLISGNSVNASYASGGGIAAYYLPHLLVSGNEITQNTAVATEQAIGGGVILWGTGLVKMENNDLSENTVNGPDGRGAGLALIYTEGNNQVNHNQFINNTVIATNLPLGGAVYIITPAVEHEIQFSSNQFFENQAGVGGGICFDLGYDARFVVENNYFYQNSAEKGGAVYTRRAHNLHFFNNLFEFNQATQIGGAIQMYDFTNNMNKSPDADTLHPKLVNNTFVNNHSNNQGGAVSCQYFWESPYIYNCIFDANDAMVGKDIFHAALGEMLVSYSNISDANIGGNGPWTGVGNINEDPLFDLSGPHPYALLPNSPCIDTGTPDTTGLNLPPCDIMGCVRIWDGDGDGMAVIDMGAYEFDSPGVGIPQFKIQHSKFNIQTYPNPFTRQTTLEFTLQQSGPVHLAIYNQMGKQVAVPLNEYKPAGVHQVSWNAAGLPAGVYYCRLIAVKNIFSGKIIKQH